MILKYILILLGIGILIFVFNSLERIKNEKIKFPALFMILLIGLIIYDFASGLSGEFITKPLIEKINPPVTDIIVEPLYYPIIKNGKEYIHIDYKNIGENPITDIFIEKKYAEIFPEGGDQNYIPVAISTTILPTKGDEGYFEFRPLEHQNISCTPSEPYTIETFVDEKERKYYQKIVGYKEGCILVPLRIKFYSKEINKEFSFLYPIKGSHSNNLFINGEKILPYGEAKDKESLKMYRTFENCSLTQEYAYCRKGTLDTKTCIKEGKNPEVNPKLKCVTSGEEVLFEFPFLNPI